MLFKAVLYLALGLASLSQAYVGPGLSIDVEPESVVPERTENVTLACQETNLGVNKIGWIRILKESGRNTYEVFAERTSLDSKVYSRAEYAETESYIGSHAYLKLNWPLAKTETIGNFFCDVVVFLEDQEAYYARTSVITVGINEDPVQLVLELQQQLDDVKEELERKIRMLWNEIEERHNGSDIRNHVWPWGSYALPQPQGGCPGNETLSRWQRGTLNLNTESDFPSKNEVSEPTALVQPVFTEVDSRNYANLHFCVKTSASTLGPVWQKGSFCIYKKDDCPAGFHEGNIFFDAQDDNENNQFSGTLPDGSFGHNVALEFCCRNDGPADVEILLPTLEPFYLFRFGGKCQKVKQMVVREEYIVVDTENGSANGANIDAYSNEFHPDGKLNDVRIEMCYYEQETPVPIQ